MNIAELAELSGMRVPHYSLRHVGEFLAACRDGLELRRQALEAEIERVSLMQALLRIADETEDEAVKEKLLSEVRKMAPEMENDSGDGVKE